MHVLIKAVTVKAYYVTLHTTYSVNCRILLCGSCPIAAHSACAKQYFKNSSGQDLIFLISKEFFVSAGYSIKKGVKSSDRVTV